MLSDFFYRSACIWLTLIGYPLGIAPYKIDRKTKRFYTSTTAQRRCSRVWMFMACQNLLLIVILFYTKRKQHFNAYNHAYLGWVLSSIWCLCLGVTAFRADTALSCLNGYLQFFERHIAMYMPHYDPNKCPINRQIDFTCAFLRWSCFGLGILQTIYSTLTSRQSPYFIDYYIPDEYYTLPVVICATIAHMIMSMLTSSILYFSALFMMSVSIHINYVIANDIRCGLGKYRTSDNLRSGHNMRITFRSLEILNKMQMETAGVLLYPMNWLMLKMVVVCGATFIKYHRFMEPAVRWLMGGWAVTGFFIWAAMLEVSGYLVYYCDKAITSWKYHEWGEERKVMSKFKKSCKPLKIAYHKMFSIRRLSVLKFCRSVAKSMFKAFVAL